MRFYLALFIVFMAFAPTYSQSDFRAGFVVTNLMDTVQGFVQYSEGGKATRKCNFKSSAEASKITYLPGQILGYGYIPLDQINNRICRLYSKKLGDF